MFWNKKNQKGEIATLLTIVSLALMLLGVSVGTKLAQTETRVNSFAADSCIQGCAVCSPQTDPPACNPAGTHESCHLVSLCNGNSKWCWAPSNSCPANSTPVVPTTAQKEKETPLTPTKAAKKLSGCGPEYCTAVVDCTKTQKTPNGKICSEKYNGYPYYVTDWQDSDESHTCSCNFECLSESGYNKYQASCSDVKPPEKPIPTNTPKPQEPISTSKPTPFNCGQFDNKQDECNQAMNEGKGCEWFQCNSKNGKCGYTDNDQDLVCNDRTCLIKRDPVSGEKGCWCRDLNPQWQGSCGGASESVCLARCQAYYDPAEPSPYAPPISPKLTSPPQNQIKSCTDVKNSEGYYLINGSCHKCISGADFPGYPSSYCKENIVCKDKQGYFMDNNNCYSCYGYRNGVSYGKKVPDGTCTYNCSQHNGNEVACLTNSAYNGCFYFQGCQRCGKDNQSASEVCGDTNINVNTKMIDPSNANFQQSIDLWTSGQISALNMSTILTQITPTPQQ